MKLFRRFQETNVRYPGIQDWSSDPIWLVLTDRQRQLAEWLAPNSQFASWKSSDNLICRDSRLYPDRSFFRGPDIVQCLNDLSMLASVGFISYLGSDIWTTDGCDFSMMGIIPLATTPPSNAPVPLEPTVEHIPPPNHTESLQDVLAPRRQRPSA